MYLNITADHYPHGKNNIAIRSTCSAHS